MQRKKILWLVSWYPNKNDLFDGDFIQRHARAAAIYHDVHVIFVTDAVMEKEKEEEWHYATGLTEQIIYFKRKEGFAARIKKQWTWKTLYQKALKKYIDKNGLPHIVHVHVVWKAGVMALWMKKKFGCDFMVTEHWGIYNNVVEDSFYTMPHVVQSLIKKCFTKAKTVVPVSVFLANGIKQITDKKTNSIICNVVDTTLFFLREEKYSKFTFVHVSNMVPLKNVKGILDAFKTLLESTGALMQLILIGNRNNEWVKYAESLGLLHSSVFFRGEISYTEVAEEMRRSHCFVLNSVMENSPCVIGEALCCGVPVIATSVGGVPELVNSTNGRLIPPNNTNALVSAMEEVYKNYTVFNPIQIAGEAAKKFSYAAVAESFNDLYTKWS